ncbi:hypothetical protein VNO77_21965 [Canavalia gladiata]|uniref:Uncharacterized protein n=1 Tax=Canavalia gladiata TaxID=3824 RepID=A0AAN9QAC7_CANGL
MSVCGVCGLDDSDLTRHVIPVRQQGSTKWDHDIYKRKGFRELLLEKRLVKYAASGEWFWDFFSRQTLEKDSQFTLLHHNCSVVRHSRGAGRQIGGLFCNFNGYNNFDAPPIAVQQQKDIAGWTNMPIAYTLA